MKVFVLLIFISLLSTKSFADSPLRISKENSSHSGCDLKVAGFDSVLEFKSFFEKLKKASEANDKKAIADNILYPLNEFAANKQNIVKNKTDFLSRFTEIWTSAVSEALHKQEFSALFCNSKGVMIGSGEIWIQKRLDGKIGITAINNI